MARSEIFLRSAAKAVDSYNMAITMGKTPVNGDVGIEIEVEGAKLPHEDKTPSPWVYHKDGSLRGEDNGEYVLQSPLKFAEVPGALDTLWKQFEKMESRLDDSNRTSVHVHLNVNSFHFNRLAAFLGIFFTLEEVLTQWCGDHRVGNLFCLRAKDAPAIISQVTNFIRRDGAVEISNNLHYAGLNFHALKKFGSLEVRALRGCSDKQTIVDWVKILERLYKVSADFDDPRSVCSLFSSSGPLAFFESLLGDMASVVRAGSGLSEEQIRDSMYEGIRMAQDICYCRDWAKFKASELEPDPFGRDPRKKKKISPLDALSISYDEYANVNPAAGMVMPTTWVSVEPVSSW